MAEIGEPDKPDSAAPSAIAGVVRTVFISYASEDVAVADKVCSALEAAGFPCWIAPRDVRAGEPYAAAIVEAINACRLMVLVLTKSAIHSRHVFREIERASSKDHRVLSIRMDATELPPELEYFLSADQWLDASGGPVERIFPALFESVRGREAGKTARSEGQPPSAPGTLRASGSGADTQAPHTSEHGHGLPFKIPFLEQLKRRNVARVAILYVAVCYLILEPFSTFLHVLALPEWTGRTLVLLMVLGFPAAVIFAWVFEMTPHGLKATAEVDPKQSIRRLTGRRLDFAIIIVLVLALGYFAADKFWLSKRSATRGAEVAPATAFSPPPHSLAVLPFVNMSGDSQQDYFSDGLSEELLNSLSRITALQVAARTSSFFFKGKQVDIADIAHKLNVGAILEGSVRRDGAHVRITAQLINAVTGFHLWSQTYDRDLRHILALQTEIAAAVTTALQATLLVNSAALIELGGTQNPLAFDAYLRGQKFSGMALDKDSLLTQIAEYSEAIRLDPRYAKAYAVKAITLRLFAGSVATGQAIRERYEEARVAAEKALALAPELGEAHAAFASVLDEGFGDYARAAVEYERALALSPGNALVLRVSANFLSSVGRTEAAVANSQRAVVLDPLNVGAHRNLGLVLHYARRDRDAIEAYNRALSINPHAGHVAAFRGLAYLSLGEFEAARESCATPPLVWDNNTCLAVVYHKLNRQSDAAAALAAVRAFYGDDGAFQYAGIYAQWGNIAKALEWLETAYRVHDPGLVDLKVEPLLEPLRQEPRFKEIERKLKFPI
jgi:TolB-like protein/Tfp pilus assembly protein PilF